MAAMRRSEGLIRDSMMFQPCFPAVVMMLRRMAKFPVPFPDRKPPEIFYLSFIIRRSRSASLLVNGTSRSVGKRSTALF